MSEEDDLEDELKRQQEKLKRLQMELLAVNDSIADNDFRMRTRLDDVAQVSADLKSGEVRQTERMKTIDGDIQRLKWWTGLLAVAIVATTGWLLAKYDGAAWLLVVGVFVAGALLASSINRYQELVSEHNEARQAAIEALENYIFLNSSTD